MKTHFWRKLFSLTAVASLALSGCANQSVQPGESASYTPMKVAAADCSYGGEIKSVEAVDAYTVKFTLCTSDASFPAKMASPIFAIQDKDFLDSHSGDSAQMTMAMNGTGPFKVILNIPNAGFELVTSPNYWGTPTSSQFLYFYWYQNPESEISAEELSTADALNTLSSSALSALKANDSFKSVKHQSLNLVYLGINNTVKPMDDVVVRKALATTIDRSKLVQNFLPAGSEVAQQMIPSGVNPGRSKSLDWYDVRPKDGLDSLKEVGFDFNQELTLAYVDAPMDYLVSPAGMAAEIKDELAAINLKVTLKPMTKEQFTEALAQGTEMLYINSFQAQYADGAAFYEIPFIRDTKPLGNPYAMIQQIFQNVQTDQSITTRQENFDILNQKFKDLVPLIPIGHVPELSYFSKNVSNAAANAYFENYENQLSSTNTVNIFEARRPVSLWPADETDYDTFRITRLLYDTLVTNGFDTTELQPSLADSWAGNSISTIWTFSLRYNVKFTNGAYLDANDVVASFAAIWDASSANHTGRTGEFTIFKQLFGEFINK